MARRGYPRRVTTPQTSTRPARGAELELTVDTLAHGGNGVARLDGYVVFVAGALPGDRVRAVVGKSKRAYAEARAVEILEPSPDRIAPLADHPGAPWQVLAYERQLAVKAEQVGDALRRIGRLEGFEQDPIVPAVEQWRYRNKLEYSFGTGPDGTLVCGFHAPGRFDEILPLDDCLLASERGNAAREQVLGWCREQGLCAWDRRGQGLLRNLVVREGRRTGELQVRLVTSPARSTATVSRPRSTARACSGRRPRGLGESTQGGETKRLERVQAPARAARRPRVPDLARGVLPDQHRDGRGALRRRGRARRRCAGTSASSTSTAASARSASSLAEPRARGGRRGDRRAGRGRRDRQRAPQRDHERARSSPATSGWRCASSSSRRASPTSASSTRRARASPRRSCAGSSRPAPKRIVYVSCNPTTLAPERGPAGRGRLRAAPRAAGRHVPADAAHRVRRAARARADSGGLRPAARRRR